ncbi:hypothetical protein AAG906_029584 [Vitis piasezkii]
MSGPSASQAEKKTVSIRMDEIGYLEINITVTGKEVVLTKDGVTLQPDIKYEKNLQIIIRDPKPGTKADPPKTGPKADPKTDQKGHDKN